MDKELLRVVIILIGVLVMIGMLIWHFFKSLRENSEAYEYEEAEYEAGGEDFDEVDDDDFPPLKLDSVVDGDALLDEQAMKPTPRPPGGDPARPAPVKPVPSRMDLPKLIEFSLVARADLGFNGEELFDAFERVGLEYGSVKVFERIDRNRLVDFAVASMGDPGTFPESNLHEFYCPGIVFYMQPRELENPLAVFEDFIDTIDTLALDLDGVVWDNQRQPLTAETIGQFRQILARK